EFEKMYATYKGAESHRSNLKRTSFKYENYTSEPASINWVSIGAVTPVKNQGTCDMEDKGCSGGYPTAAYEWIIGNGGVTTESMPMDITRSQYYSGGLFTGQCGYSLDNVVTVVGYGTTSEYYPYWLVKNSWGTGWGENGYVRILRNVNDPRGLCGIAMSPTYPTN
ncbi:Senescence-specific cysteine protease SAG12-like protein, partial [Drosera capensis]